jgi:hypothetical protein
VIAALYVQRGGAYWDVPGVDPWDEERDARRYPGPWPVVAHPPCARWCRLAGLVEHRYGIKKGDDGGTFAAALAAVRRYGGVLEHPASSDAFVQFGLPRPGRGSWQRELFGPGWVTEVSQSAYGHRARKRTWLYAVIDEPPALDWRDLSTGVWCGWGDFESYREVERLGKKERSSTPPEFKFLLLGMAGQVWKVAAA